MPKLETYHVGYSLVTTVRTLELQFSNLTTKKKFFSLSLVSVHYYIYSTLELTNTQRLLHWQHWAKRRKNVCEHLLDCNESAISGTFNTVMTSLRDNRCFFSLDYKNRKLFDKFSLRLLMKIFRSSICLPSTKTLLYKTLHTFTLLIIECTHISTGNTQTLTPKPPTKIMKACKYSDNMRKEVFAGGWTFWWFFPSLSHFCLL